MDRQNNITILMADDDEDDRQGQDVRQLVIDLLRYLHHTPFATLWTGRLRLPVTQPLVLALTFSCLPPTGKEKDS